VSIVPTTNNPGRILSPEQQRVMLLREDIVLRERARGQTFHKIEQRHKSTAHTALDGTACPCPGISNPDRIWLRAVQRDENVGFRRAEAIRLEEQRLDELQDGIWDKALKGDARAVEVALKVLERRARMLGLDFADEISGRLVEVEQQKVRLMAAALVKALQAADATDEQRRAATTAFFAELRAANKDGDDGVHDITSLPLSKEDRDLL
jgi:hypothetical protein